MTAGQLRTVKLTSALEASLPSDETEEWRYSPIGDLDLSKYSPSVAAPVAPEACELPAGLAGAVEIVDGWATSISISDEAAAQGLSIRVCEWSDEQVTTLADPNALDTLHEALTPGILEICVPAGVTIAGPVQLTSTHSGNSVAAFPHIRVVVGDNAELEVIERQTSAEGPGLTISRVDLDVGASGRLRHSTLQAVSSEHVHLARHTTTTGQQAHLVGAIAAFGGKYARLRTDADLAGRGALGELLAVYFGDAEQVHDFRTFQHHSARDTRSDLVFKGTLDDKSGSIYTGMVQIHPDGAGSNANQTNRNIKLSDDAWAWSVPNLEIENSDVRCSHASTVSPVDPDQRFYLHARGVPPLAADKLIVAGFFNEVIERFPDSLRDEIVAMVSAKLDGADLAETNASAPSDR